MVKECELNQAKSSTKLELLERQITTFESEKNHMDGIIHRSLEEMTKHGQQSEIAARLSYMKTELKRKQEVFDERYGTYETSQEMYWIPISLCLGPP